MKRALLDGALCLVIAGCGHPQPQSAAAHFTDSGVEATISASSSEAKAVLRPTMPGFHIYSVDLPQGGIDGLGIPTRLSVRAGLAPTGHATADKAVRLLTLPGLNVRLPVYPDGPVTITLPVRRTGDTAEIRVSYGACSSSTCLAPVTDHLTRLALS